MSARPPVAVLDYGIGNLRSAQKALEHVGARATLTADAEVVAAAAGVVLPGVGAFGRCMAAMEATGLDEVARAVVTSGAPFLGICVGMQLLYDASDEAPGVAGLGILPGRVRRLPGGVKHPQMQWNLVEVVAPSRLLGPVGANHWAYFVHSYAAEADDAVVAACDYGGPVVAAVERGNVFATQFHPEKSSASGLAILERFVALAGGGHP